MVEVFRTNVTDWVQAEKLRQLIQQTFAGYRATFDLDDCDKILRIVSPTPEIRVSCLQQLLTAFGFRAEVLPD